MAESSVVVTMSDILDYGDIVSYTSGYLPQFSSSSVMTNTVCTLDSGLQTIGSLYTYGDSKIQPVNVTPSYPCRSKREDSFPTFSNNDTREDIELERSRNKTMNDRYIDSPAVRPKSIQRPAPPSDELSRSSEQYVARNRHTHTQANVNRGDVYMGPSIMSSTPVPSQSSHHPSQYNTRGLRQGPTIANTLRHDTNIEQPRYPSVPQQPCEIYRSVTSTHETAPEHTAIYTNTPPKFTGQGYNSSISQEVEGQMRYPRVSWQEQGEHTTGPQGLSGHTHWQRDTNTMTGFTRQINPHSVTGHVPIEQHTSSSGPVKRKEKEPQTFDGKFNFRDFIIHFERVASWNQWNKYEQAQQLIMCLRGSALKVLSDLTLSQVGDYDTLKGALVERFSPSGREFAYQCEFKSGRREDTESIVEFGERLRTLSSLAFPNSSGEEKNRALVNQFIEGLDTHDLKKHVQFNHPKTVDQAISSAIEFEAFTNKQVLRKPRSMAEETNQVHAVGSSESEIVNSDIGTLLLQEIQKLNKKLSAPPINPNINRRPGIRVPLSERTCYVCGEKGHLSYNCPKVNQPGGEEGQSQENL